MPPTKGEIDFNSHAHVERDTLNNIPAEQAANFNSHAHVERDMMIAVTKTAMAISTHTLTWSVTFGVSLDYLCGNISTHTLTWSVTRCVLLSTAKSSRFQLTRSRGA